jgi:hypothetical protein
MFVDVIDVMIIINATASRDDEITKLQHTFKRRKPDAIVTIIANKVHSMSGCQKNKNLIKSGHQLQLITVTNKCRCKRV